MNKNEEVTNQLIERVLIMAHRRPNLNHQSPTWETLSSLLTAEAASLGSKSFSFNTVYNLRPKETIVAPGEAWDGAVKLTNILRIQMPSHEYYSMRYVTEIKPGETPSEWQTIFDLRSQKYLTSVVIWKSIFKLEIKDLPPVALDYLVARTAVSFLSGQDGDQVAIQAAQIREQEAKVLLDIERINGQSVNDNHSPFYLSSIVKLRTGL